ncbi:MAG: hypothetical protein ABI592_15750 [Acidobacteriota bacterium]
MSTEETNERTSTPASAGLFGEGFASSESMGIETSETSFSPGSTRSNTDVETENVDEGGKDTEVENVDEADETVGAEDDDEDLDEEEDEDVDEDEDEDDDDDDGDDASEKEA